MLEHRSEEQEIMDDLTISGEIIGQTLRELNTINRRLGGNQISVSAFRKLAHGHQNITLADLGCGGGDIMAEMASWARRKGLKAKFIGIDANEHIVEYAKENTRDFPEIAYSSMNILDRAFAKESYDIIHCCLFTHHFTSAQLSKLFGQFKRQSRIGVIINDLHRHPLAYWSISLLTTLFSRSSMVQNDAAISVARGFKKKEIEEIMRNAGIEKYELSWKWAFRWKLIF
ncbi:MAG: methyltransferase domain-containing protein [Ekhidna sp.]|uniref:methyltransferase domain-containing protein n=1 Tax=Ekhidna sp. TaxID=2608089 RepID=UPI0032EF78D1